jgi:hypothetical protein
MADLGETFDGSVYMEIGGDRASALGDPIRKPLDEPAILANLARFAGAPLSAHALLLDGTALNIAADYAYTNDAPMLAAAIAARGIAIFPCGPDKTPLGGIKWRKQSTTNRATIDAWWKQWPTALPAIDLAKAGLLAIDCDRHGGPDGVAAIHELLGADLTALGCPVVQIAGGGLHLIYRQLEGDEPFGNSPGALPLGVDVRGAGGYIIALGAVLPGGASYKAMEGTPDLFEAFASGQIPALTERLAALIRAKRDRENATPVETPPIQDNRRSSPSLRSDVGERAWANAALIGVATDLAAAGEGGRNNALNASSYRLGRMVARGWLDRSRVEHALTDACRANGLFASDGPKGVRDTMASGLRGGMQNPHEDLPDNRTDDATLLAEGTGVAQRLIENEGRLQQDNGPQPTAADLLDGWSFDGDALPEPPPMLIKRLVPLDGITFVGGQSGAGKTFIVIDLAVSVASGEPFFGHKVTERVGVAIFAAEGASTIASRVTVARNHKAHGEILPIAWLGAVPNLADPKEVRAMVNRLRAVDARFRASHGVRLGAVICDTLSASFSLADENDNSEAAKAIRAMKNLSDALRVVVLPVHHFGKAAETGLRGASAWRAGCDTVLSVMADRDNTTSKCRNRALVLAKSRTGEEGWRVAFDLSFVELGKDEDGDPFGACFIEPGEAESIITSAKAKPLPRAARAYIDALHIVAGENGQKVRPFGSEGSEVNAADREHVRDEFYRAWPADGEDDKAKKNAKRQAFGRGEADAIERRRIATREVGDVQLVWALAEPSQ